jgi:DNA-binding transcriptional regulator YhcF (GntR family)
MSGFPDLEIDRTSGVPVYRQAIEQIASMVRSGALRPGDRLPPERQLASELGIARGTITKVYEELSRSGIVDVTQGRGTFVSARQDVEPAGRKERAVELIRRLFSELSDLRFSHREMRALIDLLLWDLEHQAERLNIAAVDCSPEALRILARQLGFISRIGIKTILLDELASASGPEQRLSGFDLILTTATHYSELLGVAQGLKDRLVQVVVSPSQETIISLAGIKPGQRIGILCESGQFRAIIEKRLDALRITDRADHLVLPAAAARTESFVAGKEVLIVPPDFAALVDRDAARALAVFTERGGKIIPFDYQIERGSLVYLEERIKGLMEQ